MTLTVKPIPILDDNYAWFLRDEATGMTAVMDAAVVAPVADFIMAEGGRLDWLLITHHHGDHIAGIPELAQRFGAKIAGNANDAARLPPLDAALKPGDSFALGESKASILDSPGHTRGHIAWSFAADNALFCGDTLFAVGCGRLLEGTAEEMFASLAAFAPLPDATRVYCGHEYTLSNIRYALTVEPENLALMAYSVQAKAQREAGQPTIPTTLGLERAVNPFMRAKDVAELAARRAGKDSFR
ncbi:hydroxyacylglutathione hydrolase [Roseococcus sp. SDR]|uniref:hydroxyacylglutathione hydrolase n=1 Tax=Roseococcus sp. SDR TaxID=2835532 RepID=UPI001BD0DC21|nr:hydroxyacylglutathione hydrolase [Roseococcus sp. SDR]MBS7791042.1 hydroxyacylglutathione hydrolase [Roseococcus sp. SDR]MBV1846356.1 hydroxyacylglutathione hydrolase [Roseococcus sp. SDR]